MKLIDFAFEAGTPFCPSMITNSEDRITINNLLGNIDEFRNVKKINFLNGPTFIADKNGTPLEHSETFIGDTTTFQETVNVLIKEDSIIEFNDEIDIYTLEQMNEIVSIDVETLEAGVWKFPMQQGDSGIIIKQRASFLSELGYDNDLMKDRIKKNILKKVEELLDSQEISNIPLKKNVRIRVSKRSIKQ